MRTAIRDFPRALAIVPVAAALLLAALPGPALANSPWWGLDTGARPSNLRAPVSERQELQAATAPGSFTGVKVEGEYVACIGSLECIGFTGKFPSETAAALQTALEDPAAYGAGGVEVKEEPLGTRRFIVDSVGPRTDRWVPFLETEFAGSAKVPQEGGSGRLVITATNLGNAPTAGPVTLADPLPEGVTAYHAEAYVGFSNEPTPVPCAIEATGSKVSCVLTEEVPPYEAIEVEVWVSVDPDTIGPPREVVVSGGGAPEKSALQTLEVSDEAVHFGIESFAMATEEEKGAPTTQAGAHPYQLTQSLQFNVGPMDPGPRVNAAVQQAGQPRNVRVKLPPGLVGNPSPIPTCTFQQFTTKPQSLEDLVNECPPETAVGAASVTVIEPTIVHFARLAVPVFNLEPAFDEPARFGFIVAGVPVTIDTELRGGEAYAIGAKVLDASQVAQVLASSVSIWGNPGDEAHDSSRGWGCLYFSHPFPCKRPSSESEKAFLRMPVSCEGPITYGIEVEPWGVPLGSEVASATDAGPPLTGCDQLPFKPSIASTPTTKLASNPSGLDFTLDMPGEGLENPVGKSESQPRKIEVSLPPGMTANPGLAEGLVACSEVQLNRETAHSQPGEGCPEASKIGTVELETPLLKGRLLKGSLFVATPYENPFGSLIALYMTIREPDAGVFVTQSLEVKPDPATGQLVTVADEIPQLPFSTLRLHLRAGGRAPLISPPVCGGAQTTAKFYPYSISVPVVKTDTAQILAGPTGGACPGSPPFHPGFEAGSLSAAAGHYSPFYMRLTRSDGEQDMGKFSFTLPPGVVPKLAGIPYCPDAAIARAASRQGAHGGAEERSDPSCPAASQIGRTVAGAGVGSQFLYVPGKLYLAGPYHGDPISAVAVTPAVAGPFDAGVVVVREALRLNPVTHVGEVDGSASDPIPHLLKGIPLSVRELQVYADKPEFTLTPTSCARFEARSTIWGSFLDPLGHTSPQTPVGLSSLYQAVNCSKLGFKPKLSIKLKGGTRRGAHPALKALVTPHQGDANFSGAVVTLPHSAFLDQAHIRTICTRVQFAAGAGNGAECPAGAQYGFARAWSPLLDEPLEGPVFLRSSNHNLPDLVLALHGLVDIDLAARIDSVHGGIRSTFTDVPDAPVSRFILEMQGGKKGLIVNSRDLCASKNRAIVKFTGQNGKTYDSKPVLQASCKKGKGKKKK